MLTPPKSCFLTAWLLALALSLSSCRKPDAVEFDIPEGKASETFIEFARQAEVEIIFDPEIVRDVRTHAISGSMPPIQALEAMINGTGLRIQKDLQTNAVAIKKEPVFQSP